MEAVAPGIGGKIVLRGGNDVADQGTTLERLAGRLALLSPRAPVREAPIEVISAGKLDLVEFTVSAGDAVNGSMVSELGLPRNTLVAVIDRGGEVTPPTGTTVVRADDRLFVLVPHGLRADLNDVFTRWRRRV